MANFIVVVDPDPDRRKCFVDAVRQVIAPVDGLAIASCESASLSAVWAALPTAPLSYQVDDEGMSAIWGEAIEGPSGGRQNAAGLRQIWRQEARVPPPYDGFHSAVVYEPKIGLCITADLLGLFPVTYYWHKDILLVSSSPELMPLHPIFVKRLNVAGLVGLLLTNGLFDGLTLWQGVKRLGAGHALVWKPDKPPVEVKHYRIPFSSRHIDLPFSKAHEVLDAALRDAIARHVPADEPHGLLLSGGLDSRVLAGYLHENGNRISALTTGLPTDIEMRCASRVARALDFEHRPVNIAPEVYPTCSDLAAKWEHLAGGFSTITTWALLPQLRSLEPGVVIGLLGDAIVGGSHIEWAYSRPQRAMDSDSFLRRVNTWGISPEVLKRLAGPALLQEQAVGEVVDRTMARIKAVYREGADYEFQRAWCFDLYHRQRFHVGRIAWQASFGAWPVLPFIDREVLATAVGFPAAAIAERRAETHLVSERFPKLAQLPLDRSSYDHRPIKPRVRHQPIWYLRDRFGPRLRELQRLTGTLGERRSVYRIMDFNWAGWKTVRQHAEPYRDQLADLFARDELDRILPPPDVDVVPERVLSGSSGLKMLIGLMLFDRD